MAQKSLIIFITFFISLLSHRAHAEVIRASIHELRHNPQFVMVKLDLGRMAYVSQAQKALVEQIEEHHRKDEHLLLELDAQFNILSIKSIQKSLPRTADQGGSKTSGSVGTYRPTTLPDYAAARAILNAFNMKLKPGSQCYDRAHVWAYEEYVRSGFKFKKAFIFFSDRYIEKHRFKWWFHVAPLVNVIMSGTLSDRVLDPAFSIHPLQEKIWTDLFVKTKRACKQIEAYSEYVQGPEEEDCFILRTSMFFWQPKDLETFEKSQEEAFEFSEWQIQHSYREAFKN